MKKLFYILVFLSVMLLQACTIGMKSERMVDVTTIDNLNLNNITKDNFIVKFGSPDSIGVHLINDEKLDLFYYFSMGGDIHVGLTTMIGLSDKATMKADLGRMLASFDSQGVLRHLYGFSRIYEEPTYEFPENISMSKLANKIVLGKTSLSVIYEIFGQPLAKGRRFNKDKNIDHQALYYEGGAGDGGMWMVIGYDKNNIIQDIIWTSNDLKDIEGFIKLAPEINTDITGIKSDLGQSIIFKTMRSTEKFDDPAKIKILMDRNPKTFSDIKNVLGDPIAVGFKNVKEEDSMIIANYVKDEMELTGAKETSYILPSERKKGVTEGKPYFIMKSPETFFLCSFDEEENLKEIMWVEVQ